MERSPDGQPLTREMVGLARDFCHLIERVGERREPGWLKEVFGLLPRLHVAVVSLTDPGGKGPEEPDPENWPGDEHDHLEALDDRFELYTRLRSELGEHDGYWLEFDPVGDAHDDMSGSLADDLADIYYDVKRGLALFDEADDADHSDDAVHFWKRSYRLHWGQHLVDAERHLFSLKARNRLDH
ncbi:MAG: DUF5063 domain-containing protein [Gammaproteobacteria bacterium]|nr:DUF5063 domain-containing protein [Gammaproteobacteria bacterium]